jgi:histidine triad (HIT) family protein
MADDCIFCKIVAGEIQTTRVYEDDNTIAFVDLNPQAPTHLLVIPKQHLADLPELSENPQVSAAFLAGIRAVAEQEKLHAFRTVMNTGAEVGQSVFHVHAHVLAGRPMGWPPG